ncbi:dipeptidase [Planctomycetes bacterium TBK1r]|uniref:Membrane dipeptidase (Peptidase family M19) n=1 Tax=Stieleria magnilauensis TaxID=2527963 RepID=A0ABX5Y3I0_9BACT|nr:Membrane dipeptidase (Peptidase family M19) [Planctomycetes bacterium TBK1r]
MLMRMSFQVALSAATLIMPLLLMAVEPGPMPDLVLTDHGRRVHFSGLLFDGHNDLPWEIRKNGQASFNQIDIATRQPQLHTDIPRLREGGLKAQFWSVYVPADTSTTGDSLIQTLEQIDIVDRMVKRYADVFEFASTADDVERIATAGKIACMMGIEGGHSIEGSLANLKRLYDRGCRYMTLTHSKTLPWADSATDDAQHDGLTEFGKEIVREMNRIGMLVDLSHVSPAVMKQAIKVSTAPILFSHSSAAAINDHPRNVPDDVLPLVAKNGGVVMVNFYSKFIVPTDQLESNESARGSIHDVVDHLEHIIRVAGIDHVGIGSDFDGVPSLPTGLEDVSKYPLITQALLNRGYSEADVHKVLGGNVLRALRGAEAAAVKRSR